MIRPLDALRLARTKLKLRRVRLLVTVVISALLFSVLSAAAILIQGTTTSLQTFAQEGYGNRFFLQGTPQVDTTSPAVVTALVDELKPRHVALVAEKKALAKTLNLAYDEANDANLPLTARPAGAGASGGGGGGTVYELNLDHPLVQAAVATRVAATKVSFADFTAAAKAAGADTAYRGTTSSMSRANTLAIVKDGREISSSTASGESRGLRTLVDNGLALRDRQLLVPFVLAGQDLNLGADGSVPLVAPFSAAEEMLGLKPLSATASPQAKIQRIATVRAGIAGKTAQLCYRNAASTTLVQKAESVMKDWAAAKGKPDAQEPSIHYALPTTACSIPTVSKDIRSPEDKVAAQAQDRFDRQFGQVVDPAQGVVTVRIVGVSPDLEMGTGALSLTSILAELLSSNTGAGWISPLESVTNPVVAAIFAGAPDQLPVTRQVFYAEFPSAQEMRGFADAQACTLGGEVPGAEQGAAPGTSPGEAPGTSPGEAPGAGPAADATAECIASGKTFAVAPYGNSAAAIDDFSTGAYRFLTWFVLAVLALAALVMAGNIGKIIADSRRETAVFRSLGARRFQITQIYLTYVAMICALVAGLALAIGAGTAYALSAAQSPALSAIAVQAFNAKSVTQRFSLFEINPLHLSAIAACVLAAGLLASALPLLTNLRRNPIVDMRDDT